MLGLTDMKEPRVYQEAREEALEEGRQEGREAATRSLILDCSPVNSVPCLNLPRPLFIDCP